MKTLNRQNPFLWLGLLLLAWLVLGAQVMQPKSASGPFYASSEHRLGVTRWEAAPRLALSAWTTDFASGDTVAAKGTGGAGKVDELATAGKPARPTPQKSEIDVGTDLGPGARPQVSYKNGQEVPYGTSGSVRPDWCVGGVCSVEVKNYNIATNQSGLISNVSKQALQRAENLPKGMQQQVVIDVRGQVVTPQQRVQIVRGIVDKSNGAILPSSIRFKTE